LSSTYGKNFKVTIFGQSHSAGIGVTIDGLPVGFKIDLDELQRFLGRRSPGKNSYSTKRSEADIPEVLSGLANGVTCGAPFTAIIRNTDTRSSDYNEIIDVPRPSHADFTANVKYGGAQDVRGGGHFSGRLTAPLCIAGGIFKQLLREEGIDIAAHISEIRDIADEAFDLIKVSAADFEKLRKNEFPVVNAQAGEKMISLIEKIGLTGDSVGGIIECAVLGLPIGLGEPIFDGMENAIASAIFGIPAVKGIEFGNGFGCAALKGSENNDAFITDGKTIRTETNNAGGILGGITSGMPLVFRAAFKPTPSISVEQKSVSLSKMENTALKIKGRHDPCIVPRAVPCVEAAAAMAIFDALLQCKKYMGGN
jgi:chorismate synthase